MVKGGHLEDDDAAADVVVTASAQPLWLESPRLDARHTHGTGCVLSAAIAAELARGMDPVDACVAAKRFVEKAIAASVQLGGGIGPVNPGWERLV
jgi:hydroxymethylpyrimidine/phosphomethylpyrimidine kinase